MNDTELDDMLNKWDAPPVPRGLRERISAEPPRRKFRFRLPSGMIFGLGMTAVMFLLVVGIASPQTFGLGGPPPRFNLISEVLAYKSDGSSSIHEYRASTARNGVEIMLQQTYPENWLMTIHQSFFNAFHRILGLEHGPEAMASDCSFPRMTVAGQETLLGYQTTKLIANDQKTGRYTEWRAPQLDCIPMKYTWEPISNGEFRLSEEKKPLTVRINQAQ